jgi:phosphomannomutase
MKVSISGIRGVYGNDFRATDVSKFTKSFAATLIKSNNSCIVSRDTRPSGQILAYATLVSLLEQGVQVFYLDIAPTPVTFREARRHKGGIIITASHNPLDWNGLKFILNGRGISEQDLEGILTDKEYSPSTPGSVFQITSSYVADVLNFMQDRNHSHKKRIGLDPGGGAACGHVNMLFHELGYGYLAINDAYGVSSRGTDPTVENLNELGSLVTNNKLSLGFAFDVDGDRVVVVDRYGRKMEPDATLLLCIGAAIDQGARKFVVSLDTSLALEKFIKYSGGQIVYSKVGEANVVSKMLETGADAGGEGSSAGYISPKFNMCRDGLLASALISSLEEEKQDEYLDFIRNYKQQRSKVYVPNSAKFKIINELVEPLRKIATETILDDGIKALLDENSWILVRPSNTEDILRISVESTVNKTHDLFEFIKTKVLAINERIEGTADN